MEVCSGDQRLHREGTEAKWPYRLSGRQWIIGMRTPAAQLSVLLARVLALGTVLGAAAAAGSSTSTVDITVLQPNPQRSQWVAVGETETYLLIYDVSPSQRD